MLKYMLILGAAMLPGQLMAAGTVDLSNTVMVEKVSVDENGKQKVTLVEPKAVVPGDTVVFITSFSNQGSEAATDLVITNPLNKAIAYSGTSDANATLSVDGGKSWGKLEQLKVAQADGSMRAATKADVTHVRWAFARPIAAGETGKLMFRGIVK